jgi:membrane dipeptidase
MVTFVPGFLNEVCRDWFVDMVQAEADPEWPERRDAWFASNPRPPCDVRDVAAHVEHVREIAGVGCVGLGGDFDGVPATPDGLADVAGYPALMEELASRGWSDADLRKLGWENTLRVLRATER